MNNCGDFWFWFWRPAAEFLGAVCTILAIAAAIFVVVLILRVLDKRKKT